MSTIFCHFELIDFHCKNWRKKPKLTTHGGKKEDTIFILTYSAQWRVGKVKKTVTNKQSNCCPQHKTPLKTKTMCYQATWPNQYQFVHSATSRPQQTKLGKIRIHCSHYHLFPHPPLQTELTFLLTTVQSFEFNNLI